MSVLQFVLGGAARRFCGAHRAVSMDLERYRRACGPRSAGWGGCVRK
jgi:hypothetical protein